MALDRSIDSRILASDEDRLVVLVHDPGKERGAVFWASIAAAAIVAGIVAAVVFRPHVRPWMAGILVLIIFGSAAISFATRTVLVALCDEDALFLETRFVVTNLRRRKPVARLSDVTSYEVRSFIDTETNVAPYEMYELKVAGVPVFYAGSRDVVEAVGAEIVRLGGRERPYSSANPA